MKKFKITFIYDYQNETYKDEIELQANSILDAKRAAAERAKMRRLPGNTQIQVRKNIL